VYLFVKNVTGREKMAKKKVVKETKPSVKKVYSDELQEKVDQFMIALPGVQAGDVRLLYNNGRDASEGLFVNTGTAGKISKLKNDFIIQSKVKAVESAALYKDEIRVLLEFKNIKELQDIVKYMESRIKVIGKIDASRLKKGFKPDRRVIGHPRTDVSIILVDQETINYGKKKAAKRAK
jgi:hypothetical protein